MKFFLKEICGKLLGCLGFQLAIAECLAGKATHLYSTGAREGQKIEVSFNLCLVSLFLQVLRHCSAIFQFICLLYFVVYLENAFFLNSTKVRREAFQTLHFRSCYG